MTENPEVFWEYHNMGFLDLFWRKQRKQRVEETKALNQEESEEDFLEDTLDLGWFWSERKKEFQMARIKEGDRSTHFYIVGASGTGKSKFLEFLIRQDIKKGNGFGVIDPHGDLVEQIKEYLVLSLSEEELEEKVLVIDPGDEKYTVFFNPLEKIEGMSSAEISAELVEAFKKIWHDSWGARMEDLLRNTFIALIEAGLTLVDLPRFLSDEDFRLDVLDKVSHPVTLQYFKRFNNLSPKTRDEWMESTLNKVNAFLSDDRVREMFSSKSSSFSLREIMDTKRILLLKLDKGRLKDKADLLGSLFLTKLKMAAFSRSDIPSEERVPFYLYLDEFQNFATQTFCEMLSEARKYRLSLVMAHQNLSQLPKDLKDSVLANSGIQVCFRVSRSDAERLAKEFFETTGLEVKTYRLSPDRIDWDFFSYPEEWERYFQELQGLPNRFFYIKHKIEGGVLLLQTPEVLSAWREFGISKEEYQSIADGVLFGKRYLEKRKFLEKPKLKEKVELKKPKESKVRTLEEIIASMTPLEKAMLYAIGTGNFLASDVFEEANKYLKKIGASTRKYSEFKKKFYELSKKPPEGKGLIEFVKRGRSFCYWLSEWGEIAFAEKFGMPSDRAINELGGGGKLSKAIALEVIKEWLEPEGYKVRKEERIETDLTESHRGYTDLVAEKDGKEIRIEIENRSPKEQIERNIRKNLAISNELYIIASDEMAKRKVIQVALKTLFRLRKEEPNKEYTVKIASIDRLEKSEYKGWWRV